MSSSPLLSIVTTIRDRCCADRLARLLSVQGAVEFILVYPPQATPELSAEHLADRRLKIIISPDPGEVRQRLTGLLNVTSPYVLALDDDQEVHPDLVSLVAQYFGQYPDSWVLRLKTANIPAADRLRRAQPWPAPGPIGDLAICRKTTETPFPFQAGRYTGLLEMPIAPLNRAFDWRHLLPWHRRTDQNGIHIENFNHKVWRSDRVRPALVELAVAMHLWGPMGWLPAGRLDRLLGLMIQARLFQPQAPDRIVGHAMPQPEQIRCILRDSVPDEPPVHLLAELLLLRCYPQYGYLWNLILWQVYTLPRIFAKSLWRRRVRQTRPPRPHPVDSV
jgi:Glycosyl transferase family 2